MKGLKFEPYLDRVIIERPDNDSIKSAKESGIIIPDDVEGKYKPAEGVIIAVGDECRDRAKEAVGEVVLYAKFAGDALKIDGKNYFIISDDDILGFLK